MQVAHQLVASGSLWVTGGGGGDISGAATWLPPGVSYYEEAIDAIVSPVLAEHGGQPERSVRFWEWVDDHRPAAPRWHLDSVAVDPDRRRCGLGSLLLSDGSTRADAREEPVFLVTGDPGTLLWHERHGFVTQSEERAPETGPLVWFMYRRLSRR